MRFCRPGLATVCAGLLLAFGSSAASAQEDGRRVEVFANLGFGTSDWLEGDQDAFGSGPTVGGGVGFGLIGGLRIELQATALFGSYETASTRGEGTGTTLSVSLAYRFPTGSLRPYLIAGIGLYTADFSRNGTTPGDDWQNEYSTDTTAINAGLGLAYAVGPRIVIRAELRLYGAAGATSGDSGPAQATIGAAYRL